MNNFSNLNTNRKKIFSSSIFFPTMKRSIGLSFEELEVQVQGFDSLMLHNYMRETSTQSSHISLLAVHCMYIFIHLYFVHLYFNFLSHQL